MFCLHAATYVEKYGSVANKSGGGEFEASLSGKANGNNPVVAWPAEGSQRAASTSSVTSFVGEDLITSEGRMGVDTRVPYSGPPYGVSVARAWSVFEMSFLVEEALFWELDIDVSVGNDFGRIRPEFEFSSLGGGDVLSPLQESFLGKGLVSYSGIFLPDIYTFRLNSETWASIDPLGDSGLALRAYAPGDPKRRDNRPLDLLAGLASGFAGSPILLRIDRIEVGNGCVE